MQAFLIAICFYGLKCYTKKVPLCTCFEEERIFTPSYMAKSEMSAVSLFCGAAFILSGNTDIYFDVKVVLYF